MSPQGKAVAAAVIIILAIGGVSVVYFLNTSSELASQDETISSLQSTVSSLVSHPSTTTVVGTTTITTTASETAISIETTTTTATTTSTTSLVSVSTVTATITAAFALSVRVDSPDYTTNQPILLSGSVFPVPNASDVFLIVTGPAGAVAIVTSRTSSINGSYSYTLVTGGSPAWVTGHYTVTAVCAAFSATETATAQFTYVVPA